MATDNKYDRQLRLWGAKGQKALGETTVVLLRATAAGTETLKNLALPGVGRFHVLDDVAQATRAETSSNFFLDASAASRSRAETVCECLRELNPDVRGTFRHVPSLAAIDDWNATLAACGSEDGARLVVVASDLEPHVLERVSSACRSAETPLIALSSYGLIGIVRLQTPTLALMDPKPTNAPPDLRLKRSFPALDDLAASVRWNDLKDHEHGHVPYPLILHQVSRKWKAAHDGRLPGTVEEKSQFRKQIETMSRDLDRQLNFQEAVQNAYLAYTERTVDCIDELAASTDATSSLGLLLAALKRFMDRHGRAPLNGSIPDMTASTDLYVKLQTVYKEQAAADRAEMKALLANQTVDDDDLSTFCANVFAIGQLKTRTIVDECTSTEIDPELVEDWNMATFDPYEIAEHTPFLWYLGVRACNVFFKQNQRYPGTTDNWKTDIPKLQACIAEVAKQYRMEENDMVATTLLNDADMKMAHELTRYANAEIHNIASVIGGVASQEAVKIVTGQYVPLDNTYVFNGIVSVGGVYRF